MQVGSRTLIMNPASGTGDHAEYVAQKARGKGFAVWETHAAGDGVELGRRAAREGVSEVAVAGGDGTINEVLRGLVAGDHLENVTLSVIPCGTANLLANNIGVRDIDHGLALTDRGPVREIDIGMADGQPFVVSVIAGLPANASTAASGALKERFGTLAFVITGIQEAMEFEGLNLSVEAEGDAGEVFWEGDAFTVLVGNARKFIHGGGQANMEDGLFDVAVVEQMPPAGLVTEAVTDRLLGENSESVTHFRASEVRIRETSDQPITFSLDGELAEHEDLTLVAHRRALDIRVGDAYDPDP
ncbi:diacylglycerol/lipid kinase family protein [Halorarius litoreus]|uniref:diacylglycerol/lipid kinase family protein n=1 Tax=Halorarius litoreus TaxID=2962676 RepID=UPI0020CD5180|nr:diacylglycerol kinase family protein [Halorarius litoreus]